MPGGRQVLRLSLALIALLATTGCVVFEHPLSDPDTTVIDERLVGYWEPVPSGGEPKPVPGPIAVGRLEGEPNTLAAAMVALETGQLRVHRARLYPKWIDGRRYLSVREDGQQHYALVRYEIDDDETTGRLYLMDDGVVRRAIETGALAGIPELFGGRVLAEPRVLVEYLRREGATLFLWHAPQTFKRVAVE